MQISNLFVCRTSSLAQTTVGQIVTDDVLVSWTTLNESLQFVHVGHVTPKPIQMRWDLEIGQKVRSSNSNVLQTSDELAIETTNMSSCQETTVSTTQVLINRLQMPNQTIFGLFFITSQCQFEFL